MSAINEIVESYKEIVIGLQRVENDMSEVVRLLGEIIQIQENTNNMWEEFLEDL